ncbi:MAG TPA: collagen-like protein [Solirubrobacteraceae bacterium]|nr:collagen-like protein [Solirubrobacteraceae bacterium]
MASGDPDDRGGAASREALEDALGRLEERLDRASRAAERLLADAAQRVTEGREPDDPGKPGDPGNPGDPGKPGDPGNPGDPGEPARARTPPSGWQEAGAGRDRDASLLPEGDLLLGLFAAVRDRIPPDLQQRLAEAIREVLLALRALIDWYLERSDRAGSGPAEVQDIPIL